MARDIGLIRVIEGEIGFESFDGFNTFITGQGVQFMKKVELNNTYSVEYSAENMTQSWDDIEEAIINEYEDAEVTFDFGSSDEDIDKDDTWRYEVLTVNI